MSERLPPADIVGVGLVTPVGLYAAAAEAAIRAGITRARKARFINKAGERQDMHLLDIRSRAARSGAGPVGVGG